MVEKENKTLSLPDKKRGTLSLPDKKRGTLSLSNLDQKRAAKTIQQTLSGKTTKNVSIEYKYRKPTASARALKTGDHKLTEKEEDTRRSIVLRAQETSRHLAKTSAPKKAVPFLKTRD